MSKCAPNVADTAVDDALRARVDLHINGMCACVRLSTVTVVAVKYPQNGSDLRRPLKAECMGKTRWSK